MKIQKPIGRLPHWAFVLVESVSYLYSFVVNEKDKLKNICVLYKKVVLLNYMKCGEI